MADTEQNGRSDAGNYEPDTLGLIHRHQVSELQLVGLQDAANSFSNYAVWPSSEFSILRDAQLGRLKWHHRKKRGPHGLPPIRPADHNQLKPGVGNG